MLQSKLFSKTTRKVSEEEESVNAALLIKAGYVERLMAGVYSILPLGLRVLNNIAGIIREEMNAAGGQELVMPVLHPKANWETTGRWDTMDNLYKLKSSEGKEFALGPTHEEIVVPLAKKFIRSYRDLPLYVYQIQTKFRDEARAKSGVLRGREFLMKDLYSFHTDPKDLEKYYAVMMKTYAKVFKRMGLDAKVVNASGGTFSKYSHEFQVITPAGEDTIFYCKCGYAVNKEITEVGDGDKCPQCKKSNVIQARAIEVGNIFQLNTKYSEPFQLTYTDEAGEPKIVYMGCYGMGLTRLIGSIVEVSHDERGIIWPTSVAPYATHVLPLYGADAKLNKKIGKNIDEFCEALQAKGIEVLLDDRIEVSAGEKFADADLLGIPIRVIISEKTLANNAVELKHRNEKTATIMTIEKAVAMIAREGSKE